MVLRRRPCRARQGGSFDPDAPAGPLPIGAPGPAARKTAATLSPCRAPPCAASHDAAPHMPLCGARCLA